MVCEFNYPTSMKWAKKHTNQHTGDSKLGANLCCIGVEQPAYIRSGLVGGEDSAPVRSRTDPETQQAISISFQFRGMHRIDTVFRTLSI